MKNKVFILFVIGFLVLFSLDSFGETKQLKEIGRYTLVRIKGEVPTSEVMKTLVEKYAGDIKFGFDTAGYGDLYLPFIDQIRSETFIEKEMAIGDKFMWMLFRSQGKVKVVEDLEWAGQAPLPVYSFTVRKDYKNYEFIMPKPCGNISLIKIEEVIPDAVCSITVTPAKANINDPINVDMSGSQHAQSMTVDVFDSSGTKVGSQNLSPQSPRWQTKFAEPGEYLFKASAVNVEGKASTNPCEAKTYINFPPACNIWSSCLTCRNYVGRPITFDASNSTDQDGEVVKSDFEISDASGNVIDTYVDSDKPFSWDKIFNAPGVYTITVVVTDDFGAMSLPCKLDVEVTQKNCFIFAEGGPLWARGSSGPYLGAGAGLCCFIIPDVLDFVISGGGALALKGEPWKSFFMAKALLDVHAGPAFLGAGIGFTTKVKENRSADFDLIANVGVEVFNNLTSKGAIFFEGRGPVGEEVSFSKNHKLMLGFRFLF
jgi:hypothetical protein